LEEGLGFLLQPGAPPSLGLAKLNPTLVALSGGDLRHETFLMIPALEAKSSAFR